MQLYYPAEERGYDIIKNGIVIKSSIFDEEKHHDYKFILPRPSGCEFVILEPDGCWQAAWLEDEQLTYEKLEVSVQCSIAPHPHKDIVALVYKDKLQLYPKATPALEVTHQTAGDVIHTQWFDDMLCLIKLEPGAEKASLQLINEEGVQYGETIFFDHSWIVTEESTELTCLDVFLEGNTLYVLSGTVNGAELSAINLTTQEQEVLHHYYQPSAYRGSFTRKDGVVTTALIAGEEDTLRPTSALCNDPAVLFVYEGKQLIGKQQLLERDSWIGEIRWSGSSIVTDHGETHTLIISKESVIPSPQLRRDGNGYILYLPEGWVLTREETEIRVEPRG